MRSNFKTGLYNFIFILISGIGGFLLSLTGLSIGWMIGTLITACILSFVNFKPIRQLHHKKGLEPYWLKIGQLLLGIQIGQELSLSVLKVLDHGWLTIALMILFSIVFSLASGFFLYRFSNADLNTSLYGTTPGGLSSMVGIAADAGANMAVVSIIQTMRVILVESTVPFAVSIWSGIGSGKSANIVQNANQFNLTTASGLLFVIAIAALGAIAGRKIHLPAPWLLGSMIGVGIIQSLSGLFSAGNLPIWWPHNLITAAQLMIGACVGARLNRDLFTGIARTFIIGLIGSIGLMAAMFLCALLVSALTHVDPITSALAFAPGGIDVMAVTAVVLHADSTFVVAVQVIRLLAICLLLPPIFSLMNRRRRNSRTPSKAS